MPVQPHVTYPGVYIQEVSSDVKTIVPVDTATTAFVGRALRGPVDEPIVINSYADYQRIFGGLWNESSMSFAVKDFFLHGGSKAVIVRLYAPTKEALQEAKDVKAAVEALVSSIQSEADKVANAAGAAKADAEKAAQTAVKAAAAAAETALTKATPTAQSDAIKEINAAVLDDAANADVAAKAGAAKAIADNLSEGPQNLSARLAVKLEAKSPSSGSQGSGPEIELQAKWPGAWGNQLTAAAEVISDAAMRAAIAGNQSKQGDDVKAEDLFTLHVTDKLSGARESFENVTLVEGPRRLDKVLKANSELVSLATPLPLAARQDIINLDPATEFKVEAAGSASNGDELEAVHFTPSAPKKGLFALDDADIFNMLCIPPYKSDGNADLELLAKANAYCIKRRAMLLLDPPAAWNTKKKAVDGFPGFKGTIGDGTNAAVFFPRIKEANPLRDNRVETFAPCGAVAGIFARTDAQRGVWKAPAGIQATFRGVNSLSVVMTDAENGELNPLGVNCLRTMPAAGHVIWGARTLDGDDRLASQWKYIPVRRTALLIEESLYRGSQWAVFEPNDEPLWSQLRLNIGSFMHGLFRQGAFQGSSPADAYFVKCDATTTTQADIDRGIVNVVVGFAPLKPAEFVVLYIQQIAGQLAT